jgi:hypothetical protein
MAAPIPKALLRAQGTSLGPPLPLFPVRELLGIEKELRRAIPWPNSTTASSSNWEDGKLSRVKTSQRQKGRD